MTTPIDRDEVNDARLVAYIDGELDTAEREAVARALENSPALRERLELLDSGGRPFGEAFTLIMDAAPDDRLQAMFAGLMREEPRQDAPAADEKVVPLARRRSAWGSTGWQLAAAASFALTVFGAGIVTGVLYGPKPNTSGPQITAERLTERNWMDAVAQYVSLFSRETLAGMPADQEAQLSGLRRVSTALGREIAREKLAAIPTLAFKGTQLLQLEGKPVAQIAFLSDTGKPVAICIIRTPRAPEPPAPERRMGLNLVHWIKDGYGFMVIGDLPEDAIARISEAARQQLS